MLATLFAFGKKKKVVPWTPGHQQSHCLSETCEEYPIPSAHWTSSFFANKTRLTAREHGPMHVLAKRSEASFSSVACHAVLSWYNVIESVNVSHLWDFCPSVFFVLIRPILTCSTATNGHLSDVFDKSWFQCATYQTELSVSRQALPPLGHALRNSSSSTFTIILHTLHVAENVTNAVQETWPGTDQPLELVLADTSLLPVHLHGHRIWLLHESLEVLQQRTSKHFLASGTADSRISPSCLCSSGYSRTPSSGCHRHRFLGPRTLCVKF